ncbi:hypothetical protein RNAN_2327 [Rheinheimera nanhaiensis E407-8]|uniref:Uncharacterized protein n=1 Tax=Rheinheimera nanhaiensis E407-8 TaxID=562729 RepID=I1DZ47_9GAMM|nr:hypothetical protein RNAN_2327 [Rheinheimera nanhaiensis E407-8]
MKHRLFFVLLVLWAAGLPAHAHKFSTAYMDVMQQQDQPLLVWRVSLHDLTQAGALGSSHNAELSWQQVLNSETLLRSYINNRIHFTSAAGACRITTNTSDWRVKQQQQLFLVLPLQVYCGSLSGWQLSYQALFDNQHNHKLLLNWKIKPAAANLVLSPDKHFYPDVI